MNIGRIKGGRLARLCSVVLLGAFAACGSDGGEASTDSTTSGAPVTEAAVVTVESVTTTTAEVTVEPTQPAKTCPAGERLTPTNTCLPDTTTTAAVALSRDARLATVKCIDAITSYGMGEFAVTYGVDDLNEAGDLCDEATTQLEVDGVTAQDPLRDMIALRQIDLSFLVLRILSDDATSAADAAEFDDGSMAWAEKATAALDAIE